MVSLSTTEIGSVVYNLVPNLSVGISGTLTFLANQAVYYAEQFTGNSIGITAIAEVYQPAIMNLTIANVLDLMEAQGYGTKSITIGELSLTKGFKDGASQDFKNMGQKQLNEIGQHMSYYQTMC
jgi:hypothetical protein